MTIGVDTILSDRLIKLVQSQLSNEKKKTVVDEKESGLSKEYVKNLLAKENPELEGVMADLNNLASNSNILNRKIKLHLNKDINRIIISIVDKDSDRVIREIPCEELQKLALHLKEAIGVLYDKNA